MTRGGAAEGVVEHVDLRGEAGLGDETVGTVVQDVEEDGNLDAEVRRALRRDASTRGLLRLHLRGGGFARGAPADDRGGDALRGAPRRGGWWWGGGREERLGEGEREGVAGLGGRGRGKRRRGGRAERGAIVRVRSLGDADPSRAAAVHAPKRGLVRVRSRRGDGGRRRGGGARHGVRGLSLIHN